MKWEGFWRTMTALLIGAVVTMFVRDIWNKLKELFKDKWWA